MLPPWTTPKEVLLIRRRDTKGFAHGMARTLETCGFVSKFQHRSWNSQQRSTCPSAIALSSVFHFRCNLLHGTALHLTYHDCCIWKGCWKQGKIVVDTNDLPSLFGSARPLPQVVTIVASVLVTRFRLHCQLGHSSLHYVVFYGIAAAVAVVWGLGLIVVVFLFTLLLILFVSSSLSVAMFFCHRYHLHHRYRCQSFSCSWWCSHRRLIGVDCCCGSPFVVVVNSEYWSSLLTSSFFQADCCLLAYSCHRCFCSCRPRSLVIVIIAMLLLRVLVGIHKVVLSGWL